MTRDLVADLLELAAIPAPTFAEGPRLDWLERRLAGTPGARARDDAGNLVWSWGDGPPQLLLLAHVDTVFAADQSLRFAEANGRLVGPGIGDNAAAVVTVVHVVSKLLGEQLRPGAVAFTVGEEGLGNLSGANAACELAPAAAIAVEGQGLEDVLVDGVGSVRARVRVDGPGGHSWADRGRRSAVHELLRLGSELLAVGRADEPVNVGLVTGGEAVNAIAARAELVVELRSLDGEPLERFETALRGLSVPSPLEVTVEVVGRRPGGRLDRSHPLLALVRRVRAELGLPDALGAGSTDANAALAHGIPALTLGVSHGANMHTPEEWIEVESLAVGALQLERVVAEALA